MEYIKTNILSKTQLTSDIFVINVERKNVEISTGQFFMLKSWDKELTFMRPISVFNADDESISFMFRVVGEGTRILSQLDRGDSLYMLGPCGNGYPLEQIKGRIALVGGGVGIPPLCETAKQLKKNGAHVDAFLGFKDKVFAIKDFEAICDNVMISTENGSVGHKGFVTDIMKAGDYDAVLTCGPEVMMRKVAKMCSEAKTLCFCSLEHRMACGIGACLGCSIRTANGMKRVCKDGPVFNSSDLPW